MAKKLAANADHYDTEALCMAYVDSHIDSDAYKHLAARSRTRARKQFATAKKMFEVLQKAYGNVNWQHTDMNKFQDLKMTKCFNSFWAEFQILVLELDHNKSILISELKFKLTPLLSRAMASGMSWSTDIHEYAKQCQQAYQNLKDIKIQTPAANFTENWYNQGGTNTNGNTSTNMGTNVNAKTANCSERLANFSYSRPLSIASNPAIAIHSACSKAIRLSKEEIAKLQREDRCFHCKEIKNHQLRCPKEWQPMTAITNPSTALALVNISEVAVPQPGHVEAENA